MILSGDLHKAIVTAWNASQLNNFFKNLWSSANRDEFPVLHDQEAAPGQPFPYCVFEQEQGSTTSRMTSDTKNGRYEIRQVPVQFRVHARAGFDGRTAKRLATDLIEEIAKVFGGHPTVGNPQFTLDNGTVLQSTYMNDWGMRTGDEEYQWVIRYQFLLDVPVAA